MVMQVQLFLFSSLLRTQSLHPLHPRPHPYLHTHTHTHLHPHLHPRLQATALPSANWDLHTANTSLWFCAATYCNATTYKSRDWVGLTETFHCTEVVHGEGLTGLLSDTNGYVGYQPSTSTIWVAFRGSTSFENWADDALFVRVCYDRASCVDCEVHEGYHIAEQAVIKEVLQEVKRLQLMFPSYKVIVTGHSLGAAVAQLVALDMVLHDIAVSSLYTFGCPRVGNAAFAAFAGKKIPQTYRIVHDHDIVPHILPLETGFRHVCTEYFEDASGNIRKCDSSCEDPKCANQYYHDPVEFDRDLVSFKSPGWTAHVKYLKQNITSCAYVSGSTK